MTTLHHYHTHIKQVDRSERGIQVIVSHGIVRREPSYGQQRGQAAWVAKRLYERGDAIGVFGVEDVRSSFNETQVTLGPPRT